jgi:signal transduction histidine kinase
MVYDRPSNVARRTRIEVVGTSESQDSRASVAQLQTHGSSTALVRGIASYAVVAWLFTTVVPHSSSIAKFATDWMALPVQLFAALACAHAASRSRPPKAQARTCWALLCTASLLGCVSLFYWNLWEPHQSVPWLAAGDVLYLIDYGLIGAALASLLAPLPGTFRSALTWLDGLAILVAVLASVWAITYGPLAPPPPSTALPLGYVLAYAIAAAWLLIVGSLVWLRNPAGPGGRWTTALIVAAVVQAAWIIGWIGSWLTTSDFLAYLADYGEVVCYSLVGVAALRMPESGPDLGVAHDVRRRALVFLPTVAVLVSVALISGLLANHAGAGAWIATGLILLCALLLLTRHSIAIADFERLRDELALRASDERISELVRQSSDAFMIVTPGGRISYASPAVEAVLNTPPSRLLGVELAAAFAPTHSIAIAELLDAVTNRPAEGASVELTMPVASAISRTTRLVASNRLANERIRGIALVAIDVSRERALEREVIDVANAERFRLAADVHDGIGQELTGIALLLQGFVNRGGAQSEDRGHQLLEVIDHLNRTIRSVRDLARGLSPLYEVHGSLTGALRTLAAHAVAPLVDVSIDPKFEDRRIDSATGEQLYRIAAEAVQNARRHAACTRIQVSLTIEPGVLVLSVADNGNGCRLEDASVVGRGSGLRIMKYRAKIVGAALQIDSNPTVGTRVTATMDLRSSDRVPGPAGIANRETRAAVGLGLSH